MQLFSLLLEILIIIYSIISIQSENNHTPIKWFIKDRYIYYIETEAKVSILRNILISLFIGIKIL